MLVMRLLGGELFLGSSVHLGEMIFFRRVPLGPEGGAIGAVVGVEGRARLVGSAHVIKII